MHVGIEFDTMCLRLQATAFKEGMEMATKMFKEARALLA